MPKEINVLEAPIGNETEDEVRAAIKTQYPSFTLARLSKVEDKGVWKIRLEKEAEFPLKGLGPDDEGKDEVDAPPPGEDDASPADKSPPKTPADDDSDDDFTDGDDKLGDDKPPFGKKPLDGDSPEGGDPITRIEHLLHDLKKVIPQLQAMLRGDGAPGGDMPMPPPHGGPGMDGPPGGPGGPGGMSGRPHDLPMGPGAPHMPPGAGFHGQPRGQMPTFTHLNTVRLEREASVEPRQARKELLEDYPSHKIEEFTRSGDKYIVKLVRR